jgi:hypothetical protein
MEFSAAGSDGFDLLHFEPSRRGSSFRVCVFGDEIDSMAVPSASLESAVLLSRMLSRVFL